MEPQIVINGIALSVGQAMTVRVAIESFASELVQNGWGDDDHGREMTRRYRANIDAIREIIRSP